MQHKLKFGINIIFRYFLLFFFIVYFLLESNLSILLNMWNQDYQVTHNRLHVIRIW